MYPQFQSREMERSETTSVAVREEEGCSLSFSVGSWRGGKQPQLQSGEGIESHVQFSETLGFSPSSEGMGSEFQSGVPRESDMATTSVTPFV